MTTDLEMNVFECPKGFNGEPSARCKSSQTPKKCALHPMEPFCTLSFPHTVTGGVLKNAGVFETDGGEIEGC